MEGAMVASLAGMFASVWHCICGATNDRNARVCHNCQWPIEKAAIGIGLQPVTTPKLDNKD